MGMAVTAAAFGIFLTGATSANASTRVSVKQGDTVSKIANTYKVSPKAIAKANHLKNMNLIFVGENLLIPTASEPVAASAPVQKVPVVSAPVAKAAPAPKAKVAPKVKTAIKAAPAEVPAEPVAVKKAPVKAVQPAQPVAAPQTQQSVKPAAQPVQPAKQAQVVKPVKTTPKSSYSSVDNGGSAKAWIVSHESGGNYGARNGQYVGKYQLSNSYLHGDYSAANQEKAANSYVSSRYGSWNNAKQHWVSNGWY